LPPPSTVQRGAKVQRRQSMKRYSKMGRDRYNELMLDQSAKLTQEEIDDGWHFCTEWDFLLIHKSWMEFECCDCYGDK
jgi:hypothetical protein